MSSGMAMPTDAEPRAVFERIAVAVDDSDCSRWAVELAGALAERLGSAVALIHVVEVTPAVGPEVFITEPAPLLETTWSGEDVLNRVQTALPGSVTAERIIRQGEARSGILAAAGEWGAELIVMGTHGRGGVKRFLLGSVSAAIVRQAPCPVLTVGHKPKGRV